MLAAKVTKNQGLTPAKARAEFIEGRIRNSKAKVKIELPVVPFIKAITIKAILKALKTYKNAYR